MVTHDSGSYVKYVRSSCPDNYNLIVTEEQWEALNIKYYWINNEIYNHLAYIAKE